MKYLVAFTAGGTLALIVAAGVISFFHFVTAERRRSMARVFRDRARRVVPRQPRLSRFDAPVKLQSEREPRRQPFHNETVVSD
jgi:hypothetical protein